MSLNIPPFDLTSALCAQVDPTLWFPATNDRSAITTAVGICGACPVMQECRDYAVADPDLVGIWGGLTTRQRRRVRTGGNVTGLRACDRPAGRQRRSESCRSAVLCDACRAGENEYQRQRRARQANEVGVA